jgi:hypothetical protein
MIDGKAFELGGVVVPMHAALGLQQRIESAGGSASFRLARGALIKQTVWDKLRVTLTGEGWCPVGLGGLDYSQSMTLKCGLPESITGGAVVTLPAARRTDTGFLPFARAHTPTGWQQTAVSIAGNVATCTAVSGAVAYSVWYYPQLTVFANPPSVEFDGAGAAVAWEIVCEES